MLPTSLCETWRATVCSLGLLLSEATAVPVWVMEDNLYVDIRSVCTEAVTPDRDSEENYSFFPCVIFLRLHHALLYDCSMSIHDTRYAKY